jgi:hypothetical protein
MLLPLLVAALLQAAAPATPAAVVPAAPAAGQAPPIAEDRLVAEAPADRAGFSKVGFYPLWEGSASVLGHRQALLGTDYLELGLFDRFQVGLRPQEYLFRTPNVHGKVQLLSRGTLELSAQLEVLSLLPGATTVFTSSNFVSRIDNTRGALWVVPLGSTLSWLLADFVALHTTLSVMSVAGSVQPLYASVALSSVLELRALRRVAFFLHATEVGFWRHDQYVLGASFKLTFGWFYSQLGYFYRFSPDGRQASPLVSLGASL